MADLDLRTFTRNILLLFAILSVLVIGEMVLVAGEEPPASVHEFSKQGELSRVTPDRILPAPAL